MRLALDALEHHTAIKHPQQMHYRDTAIEALRQALEQPSDIESAVRAENEACAFIASKEAQRWEYPSHASAAAVLISDAIRARIKND